MRKSTKLLLAICISTAFFVVEIVIGFRQRSLALIADSFHICSDVIGFIIALVAVRLADRKTGYPPTFSYGLQRGPTLGAFSNGCFLMGLGFAIGLQSIERLITPEHVDDPKLVLIVGGVGLALNILAAFVVHDHGDHAHEHGKKDAHPAHVASTFGEDGSIAREEQRISTTITLRTMPDTHATHVHTLRQPTSRSGYDLGLLGAMIHLLGDALNSVAVMVAAVVIWQTGFIRADAIASLVVSFMIIGTAVPLVKKSGRLLLEIAPNGVDLEGVEQDIRSLEGVEDLHELHAYSLTQKIHIASLHVLVAPHTTVKEFVSTARKIRECLHAWGLHGGVTVHPEIIEHRAVKPAPNEESVPGISTPATAGASTAVETSAATSTSGLTSRNCEVPCIEDECGEQACCT